MGFLGGSDSKESTCNEEDLDLSLGWEYPLEKDRATHSSILACRIPWTRGAWWAIVYSVAQSWTQMKQLSILQYKIKSFLKNKHMLSMGDTGY